MRKFAYAAVFAAAISTPALAGALIAHSAISVLGAPCTGDCSVGGAPGGNGAVNSDGKAQGGRQTINAGPLGTVTQSGSGTVQGGQQAGHASITGPLVNGSISGNFTDSTNPKGHCTGDFADAC
jgi:hypothetical protein